MEAGRNEEALAAFQQALALRPRDPLMQRNIGDILVRLGRIREARAAYSEGVRVAREAVAVNQKNPEAHGALALCLAKTGELDEALKHVETATALAPNAHQSYYRRAAILALAGRRDEALAALRAALQRGLSPAIVVRDDDFKALQDSKEFQQLIKSGV
jgi:type II protein arginine methyltransferase